MKFSFSKRIIFLIPKKNKLADNCMKFRISIFLVGPYFFMLLLLLFMRIIGVIFYIISYSNRLRENKRTATAFECGLDERAPINNFSFYCYYYIILFVLFDVELCCLLPTIEKGLRGYFFFILIVFLSSTLIELYDGSLNWILNTYQVGGPYFICKINKMYKRHIWN